MRFIFVFSLTLALALAIESNFYREEPCSEARGYCVLESECHHAVSDAHKNLCSGQKKDGAVCCTDFPIEKVNCYQQHNDCMDVKTCPKNLNIGQKGCPSGKTCCVLV